MRLLYLIIAGIFLKTCHSVDDGTESDGDGSRKILGSSVVTSVSVVMDTGNKKNTIYTDAVGKPQSKPTNPSELASPIDLLNPDRYEFYTFDENGNLIKRRMSLDEIKSIIARGDSDDLDLDSFTSQGFLPERRVSDVVSSVQSVLKDEMEILKGPVIKPIFDTPDVSDSWSMILPAVFGNSGEDIKPEKPVGYVTPDTIMLEPNSPVAPSTSGPQKVDILLNSIATTKRTTTKIPSTSTVHVSQPIYYSSTALPITKTTPSTTEPSLNVEIISNGISTILNDLSKKPTSEVTPGEVDETIPPTRAPIVRPTNPPLVRDVTKTTVTKMTYAPTSTSTQKITSTNQAITSLKPTIQWTSTSFKPVSTQLSDANYKTSSTPSSTVSAAPNIFGLPSFINVNLELASDKPSSTLKPTRSTPFNNIFGFPMSVEEKNSPTVIIRTSTSPKPPRTTSIMSSTSQLNIKPQLSTTGTVASSSLATSTITSPPVTTEKTVDKIASSNILNNAETYSKTSTWAPNLEDTQLFNIFKEVLSQPTTENSRNISSLPATSTESLIADSTRINDILNFESSKIQTTESNADLSTLPTEIFQQNIQTTINEGATTKLPSILNALNDKQKLSASELLDQLLLTTNIYEINTELASSKLNSSDVDVRFDHSESSTLPVQESEQQTTTTDHDIISYPPTTDLTLIHSIEQLLSQAVGDVQAALNQTTESTGYSSSETQASDVTTSSTEPESISTTLSNPSIEASNNDNLNNSVEALLSQVNDHTNKIVFTEKPNVDVTYRRVEDNASTTTTSPNGTVNQQLTTENSQTETQEPERESTTIYYVIKKDSATEEAAPNLVNITVLSLNSTKNRTKPAKADLSLEEELIKEEMKNLTLLQNSNKLSSTSINNNNQTADSTSLITTTAAQDEVTEQTSTFISEAETTTNDVRFDQEITTETVTFTNATPVQSSTSTKAPKPSIVITINENNTIVTENGKLVANKTISPPPSLANVSKAATTSTLPPTKLQKNSTQDQTWTLVSTVAPQHAADQNVPPPTIPYPEVIDPPVPVDLVPKPMQGFGLEESTASLDVDVHQFVQLCNELAFGFWKTVTTGLSSARSIFVSPFAATSMLAMVFLGAKGATSEEMNEILKLDDMVTFNPHLTFKSVSESLTSEPNSGVATTAIIRELFSDRSKGKLLDFYKNRVRAFYDGFAEEVSYREIGDVIRRRSNLLVKKYSNGKYAQFLNDASIVARSPLSGISINIFETDCSQTSSEGRDGEIHFIVFPTMKQRRLIPIPAVVYKSGFLAGYEPSLDATAVALGGKDQVVSTILVIPGQQGLAAPGDGLARLEKRLVESSFKKGAWSRLLRSLIPRPGLEVQVPRFSHRSVINATNTLQRMGLHELFNPDSADLRGLNGVANELHLSDVIQINKFATCGEKRKDESHHSEIYPATTMRARAARRLHLTTLDQDEPRDYQRAFHDPLHDPSLLELPLSLRPRQARIPNVPRLRFDRPFLYFVRHNPTGLILHMGRFNPRLLP